MPKKQALFISFLLALLSLLYQYRLDFFNTSVNLPLSQATLNAFIKQATNAKLFEVIDVSSQQRIGYYAVDFINTREGIEKADLKITTAQFKHKAINAQLSWIQYQPQFFSMEKINRTPHGIVLEKTKNQYQQKIELTEIGGDILLENQWFFQLPPCESLAIDQPQKPISFQITTVLPQPSLGQYWCLSPTQILAYDRNEFYLLSFHKQGELQSIEGKDLQIKAITVNDPQYQELLSTSIASQLKKSINLLDRFKPKASVIKEQKHDQASHKAIPMLWQFDHLKLSPQFHQLITQYSLQHKITLLDQSKPSAKAKTEGLTQSIHSVKPLMAPSSLVFLSQKYPSILRSDIIDFAYQQAGLSYEYIALKNIPFSKTITAQQSIVSPLPPPLPLTKHQKALIQAWIMDFLKDPIHLSLKNKLIQNHQLSPPYQIEDIKQLVQAINQALALFLTQENQPFKPSIEEIFKQRKGDCNEFSTLLVAILNELGLSATLVLGIVQPDPTIQALQVKQTMTIDFSYHAWVAIWTGESILEVDPLWQDFEFTSPHLPIAFGEMGYESIQENLGKLRLGLKIK